MTKFTFADRYADAGLSPSAQVIQSRQEPANRIAENITDDQIFALVLAYYGHSNVDLDWFRDKFIEEDASFSLVNNEREARVLAALVLGQLIQKENSIAILAVSIGCIRGLRTPSQSAWLVVEAEESLLRLSVTSRQSESIETKIAPTTTPKLSDEITALAAEDWTALITILGKIRTETQNSTRTVANQTTSALQALTHQSKLMREENQMLWWLIGGHTSAFEQSFATLNTRQAAIVGAIDLGDLTTYSHFGPVAMPAMLERVIALAKKPKGQTLDLAAVIDSFPEKDLKRLQVPQSLPPLLAPVSEAIKLAQLMGNSAWHNRFKENTGLEHTFNIESITLAEQLYRECLLEQLI